ncbi:NAD(P)/FAD-dependent oxidoreductase [Rhizobium sp. BE258]|uniref:NAD(P)/FAD-dependent oxidoreductase n=1 Tax=Rhizobium sp. BE258 TaxID=2817722 RepID=UPI00285B1F81|nr:NAD(P)/FAD-dependent oxidoreductase [Rhizobium sp. BE258]MDR7145319.1 L-2-hydroxyglutarate oxidase LhgO [Rhizobium sp. BE258]
MDRLRTDAVVIGAGVVGLAVARRLALAGLETIILEQADQIGSVTSSRNSEVVHAGIYYPTGSIKARTCVAGREALYAYCEARQIRAERVGKLLVCVSDDERPKLQAIAEAAKRNGVRDLVRLAPDETAALEPEVNCTAAIFSPSTGIIDSHAYMLALRADFEASGGMIAFLTPALSIEASSSGHVISCGGQEPAVIEARFVVNSAGHGAPPLARKTAGLNKDGMPDQWFAKGNYFSLEGRQPFRHLVYPMPDRAGLGVHATIDLAGRCRFGPDVEWIGADGPIAVDARRATSFYNAIRRYWPHLQDDTLIPDYAGIRPKIHSEAMPMPDFRIDGPSGHGIAGLVNLFGIESPGLTASLAIASHVASLLSLARPDDLLF